MQYETKTHVRERVNDWLHHCSESVLMHDFEEMEAEIMDQMEVEALP